MSLSTHPFSKARFLCWYSSVSKRLYLSSNRTSVSREVVTMEMTFNLISWSSSDDLWVELVPDSFPSNHNINVGVVSDVDRSEFRSSYTTGKFEMTFRSGERAWEGKRIHIVLVPCREVVSISGRFALNLRRDYTLGTLKKCPLFKRPLFGGSIIH